MLLFDIDGTLLLTGGAGSVAFERAFEELFGIKDCWGDVHPDGKTDPIIFDEIIRNNLGRKLSEDEYLRLCRRYLLYFRDEVFNTQKFRLMPGIPRLLDALAAEKEFALGIATGNFEEAAWLKLERGGLKDYFRFGGFGSDSHDRTAMTQTAIERGRKLLGKSFHPEDILVIGDSMHDVIAGKNLGVITIAVATGSTGREELARHQPDFLLETLEDTSHFLTLIRSASRV